MFQRKVNYRAQGHMSWAAPWPGGMPPAQRHPSPALSAGPAHTLWVHGHLLLQSLCPVPFRDIFLLQQDGPQGDGRRRPSCTMLSGPERGGRQQEESTMSTLAVKGQQRSARLVLAPRALPVCFLHLSWKLRT